MEESHSGLVRPPAKRLPGLLLVQGSNPCSSASTMKRGDLVRDRRVFAPPANRGGGFVPDAFTHSCRRRPSQPEPLTRCPPIAPQAVSFRAVTILSGRGQRIARGGPPAVQTAAPPSSGLPPAAVVGSVLRHRGAAASGGLR